MKRATTIKIGIFCFITLVLYLWGSRDFTLEQDILRSIYNPSQQEKKVFDFYQKHSVYQDKIFIVFHEGIDDELKSAVETRLAAAGYRPFASSLKERSSNAAALMRLMPFLYPEGVPGLLDPAVLAAKAEKIERYLTLPGAGKIWENLKQDPLLVSEQMLPEALRRFAAAGDKAAPMKPVLIYERHSALEYEKIAPLYDFLMAHADKVGFMGGDLFAYENYRAINDDIIFSVSLSLVLNLILFALICPTPRLLVFLTAGTLLSYFSGLCLTRLFYPYIYSIVLVFTSSFIGFNNEYLVHFSGITPEKRAKAALGLGSAIGTTLIGFLVLLFARNEIIKQMALVSIGGMIGFIGLMLSFQSSLSEVRYRTFRLPRLELKRSWMVALWVMLAIGIGLLSRVPFRTDIKDFRFQSEQIERQTHYFENLMAGFGMSRVYAMRTSDAALETTWRENASSAAFHPLALFTDREQQLNRISLLQTQLTEAREGLAALLKAKGFKLPDEFALPGLLQPLTAREYLELWQAFTFLPFYAQIDGESYLFVSQDQSPASGIMMSPVQYYNNTLTFMQKNMTILFAIGLLFMFLYLIPLQRQLDSILYIYLPLATAILVLLALARFTGSTVHFIHIVGMALVIAVAIDYSAIHVSSDFAAIEQSKLVLTGVSTLLTFGVLAFCKHPVIRDLGITVTVGSGVSLLLSLFLAVDTSQRPLPKAHKQRSALKSIAQREEP
jgi:hypothetical protein